MFIIKGILRFAQNDSTTRTFLSSWDSLQIWLVFITTKSMTEKAPHHAPSSLRANVLMSEAIYNMSYLFTSPTIKDCFRIVIFLAMTKESNDNQILRNNKLQTFLYLQDYTQIRWAFRTDRDKMGG